MHGDTIHREPTPEYCAWSNMIQRCTNPKHPSFREYGGAGIAVCRRWRESFAAFLADMGRRPSARHSIDRYPDNSGGYEPGNCRWATQSEQNFNRRPRRRLSDSKWARYKRAQRARGGHQQRQHA